MFTWKCKNKKRKVITVEVDNLKQLRKIMGLRFNRIMFDNMNYKSIKAGVNLAKEKYETEVSGGVGIKNIKKIASTGVDRISIGELTHSSSALDIKLEI